MKWRLVDTGKSRYYEFKKGGHSAFYTTKHGQDDLISDANPLFLKQIHSKVIVDIDAAVEFVGDGLVSSLDRCIGVKVADCLPVYLFAPGKICVIHCGWRGIIAGIAKEAKRLLKNFTYVMGASIGTCCYEVQQDVADLFTHDYPHAVKQYDGGYFLDLKAAVMHDLGSGSLIGALDLCTKCHPESFFSHRLGDGKRNYAFISGSTGNDSSRRPEG
ncbi:MAG: polyphenol oxidase family protein [candidate division WOR-3 bacterium]|nr:MAG: polyphenol oxidase family protein [candidate division WOR-3 bacterium]